MESASKDEKPPFLGISVMKEVQGAQADVETELRMPGSKSTDKLHTYVIYCKYVEIHNTSPPRRSVYHRSSRSRFSAQP